MQQNKTSTYDFIIVGQGLAGSILAITLIKKGYSVCLIDEQKDTSSSKVAAGIWNPIVFKRLTKSWFADEVIPELYTFYKYCESKLETRLIYQKTIIKELVNDNEEKFWLKQVEKNKPYLDKTIVENLNITNTDFISKSASVLSSGHLDVNTFLNSVCQFLLRHQVFISEFFDYTQLVITANEVKYKKLTATQIIFCEGYKVSNNPHFNWIPLKPAKGEVLIIKMDHFVLNDHIINKGIFILPLGNQLYKVGATYDWDDLTEIPTFNKKQELINKFSELITCPYTIISHQAGIRPSAIDRRPIIGGHPNYKNMFVFNGFGTKAVMLAPYFAMHLLEHILHKKDLLKEVDLKRFKNSIIKE